MSDLDADIAELKSSSHFEKLLEIRRLKDKWKGPNTFAPSNQAFRNALQILRRASTRGIEPSQLLAVSEGGIAVYFIFLEDKEVKIAKLEADNEQKLCLMLSDRVNGSLFVDDRDYSESNLDLFLDKVVCFRDDNKGQKADV